MTENTTAPAERHLTRRSVATAAAWTVPAIAVAATAPAAAASGDVELGAYRLQGTCGILGVIGPGFTLTAASNAPLPVGTSIIITGSGVANIGVFSVTGGTASVSVLSGTARQITLTAPLAAGASLAFRTTLSISVAFTLNSVVSVPTGYVGTGSKSTGSVSSTLILCSAT